MRRDLMDATSAVKILIAIAVGIGLVLVVMAALQRRLMYFPTTERTLPSAVGLIGVRERDLPVSGGAHVVVWIATAKPGQPTLLYFHGNGGALADRAPRFARFMAQGWGVVMMSYRGYSGSTGAPSEAANVADAQLTYDWLVRQGVPATSIILYGESLGTGVATQVAAARPVAGLILDAPYTSFADMARRIYPFLPVDWLLLDRYDTAQHIRRVAAPVLVLHGARDEVIPVAMGREVARIAGASATYVEFPNGGHSDLYVDGNDALSHVRAFVTRLEFR